MIRFREATRRDVPAIVALLAEDALGALREGTDLAPYLAAFDAMRAEGGNLVIVGELAGRIVATCQLTFITGLSLRASRRAQVESVRVAADLRGQGVGAALMVEVEARARAAECSLIQLTTNAGRAQARKFYEALGFTPTHIGYKRDLS